LSNWALANQYNYSKLNYKSAEFKSMKVKGNKVILNFKFFNKDEFVSTENIKGFSIAGADKVFYPANVSINKNKKSVTLQSDKVAKPVAVRYGFLDCFESNLKTKSDLPISVFRTDFW
jgi:sialate O-acetylesterase